VPKLNPISWNDLVRGLRKFAFHGPYQQGKHPYMVRGSLVLTVPNPHKKEIGVDLLTRILKQAGVSRKNWLMKK